MRRKPLNKHLRVQVLNRDGYKCCMCGRSQKEVSLEVDHIVPASQGGTDDLGNLATLCHDCNIGKSDYQFQNYVSMNLLPENIERHFKFYHDSKIGDYEKFHLYCYYKTSPHREGPDGEFHHEWKITGTDYAVSSNRTGLENRRRSEETQIFKESIRRQLADERKRLILTEEGLVKT